MRLRGREENFYKLNTYRRPNQWWAELGEQSWAKLCLDNYSNTLFTSTYRVSGLKYRNLFCTRIVLAGAPGFQRLSVYGGVRGVMLHDFSNNLNNHLNTGSH